MGLVSSNAVDQEGFVCGVPKIWVDLGWQTSAFPMCGHSLARCPFSPYL